MGESGLFLFVVAERSATATLNYQAVLVGFGLEEVLGNLRFVATLRNAENQVDPLVQMARDVRRLKSFSHFYDEHGGGWGPVWQAHVADFLPHMIRAQISIRSIQEEASVSEIELWDQFFIICQYFLTVLPGDVHIVENPIWRPTQRLILQFDQICGNLSDFIVLDGPSRRVVR